MELFKSDFQKRMLRQRIRNEHPIRREYLIDHDIIMWRDPEWQQPDRRRVDAYQYGGDKAINIVRDNNAIARTLPKNGDYRPYDRNAILRQFY